MEARPSSAPLVPLFSLAALLFAAAPLGAQCELELARLAPDDASPGAAVGYRVHVDGDVALLAAVYDDAPEWSSGSVYLCLRSAGGDWSLDRKLTAADGAGDDRFGWSVQVDGDRIAVGAPGVDAPGESNRGAVYLFERDAGGPDAWGQVAKLEPESVGAGAHFGYALDLEGDCLLVGAPNFEGVDAAGTAYLYEQDPSDPDGWRVTHKLAPSDPTFSLSYGYEVALDEDVAVVTSGVAALLSPTFAIYVYERDAGGPDAFGEIGLIPGPSGANLIGPDYFAHEITLSDGLLVAAAPGEYDFVANTFGSLYLFERDRGGPNGFRLLRRITSQLAPMTAFLTDSVALDGEWLVAGISYSWIGGLEGVGSVVVFGRDVGGPSAFGELAVLTASDLHALGFFGMELALDGATLVVGSPEEFFGGPSSGLGYVFDLDPLARARWRNDANGVNPATYVAATPRLGADWTATVDVAASGHDVAVLVGFAGAVEIPLAAGPVVLAFGPGGELLGAPVEAGPLAQFELALPADVSLCGLSLSTQAVLLGGQPLALSNAQDLVLGVH